MNREIRSLTGLRGIAALWVVACHWSGAELSGIARDIALHGYVAVDLFMVLSGYVLAMTYIPRGTGYGAFLWQRFCRLYPLYALATLVCLAEQCWLDRCPAAGDVASNLLMTTTHLWEVDAIDGPSWSISVEFTLNLFFPLFVLTCRRGWVAIPCFAALIAVSVLNHLWDGGVLGELGTLDTRLMYLRCGPEFALGMLCWRCRPVFGGTGWLSAIAVAMLAMTPFKAADIPFTALSCLLVIGLASEKSRIAAALGSRVPHWLGTISFSLYLWHAAFLPLRDLWLHWMPASAANTLNLALVLGWSTLSYRAFEIPARRWLRGKAFAPRIG
jgi:peptidoglycan/LPS O-acetylase OafA/YrhL